MDERVDLRALVIGAAVGVAVWQIAALYQGSSGLPFLVGLLTYALLYALAWRERR